MLQAASFGHVDQRGVSRLADGLASSSTLAVLQ